MAEPARIGLDNSVFRGRIRRSFQGMEDESMPAVRPVARRTSAHFENTRSARVVAPPSSAAITQAALNMAPETASTEVNTVPDQSAIITIPETGGLPISEAALSGAETIEVASAHNHSPLRFALFTMACIVFLVGVVLSVQTMRANRSAAAQIQGLYEQINGQQDRFSGR